MELVRPDKTERFQKGLDEIDKMIAGGGYSAAISELRKTAGYADTGINWLSLIKRGYILSEDTKDPSYFRKYCSKAFKVYPGNEDIRAFQVYSLLEQKKYKEASDLSQAINSSYYSGLKVEAALSAEFSSDTIADPFSYLLNLLETGEDPSIFERAASITGNKKLLFDAAVLRMQKGEVKPAYDLVENLTGSWVNDEAIGLMAIDAGEYNQALVRFLNQNQMDVHNHNEKWANQLIIADLYQIGGDIDNAARFYRRSIEINEKGDWHQYANYSRLLKEQGRFRDSMDTLQKAISLFPEDEKQLVVSMVQNHFDKNRSTTERYLKSFLDKHPDDPEANLLVIKHFPVQTTPEKYGARIWELYNKNPSDRKIAEFLIWYLLGVGDLEGTTLVLDRFDRDSGKSFWTVFYRALSLSMNKGFNEAENLLIESDNMKETWYTHYNLAVIQLFLKKYNEALLNLQRADFLLSRTGKSENKNLAGIRTKMASAYIGLKRIDNARVELQEALKLDSDNLEAALLTRQIQGNGGTD